MRIRFFVTTRNGTPVAGSEVEALVRCGTFHPAEAKGSPPGGARAEAGTESVAQAPATILGRLIASGLVHRLRGKDGFTFVLGSTRTDRCGYGVIDLGGLPETSRTVASAAILAAALGDGGDLVLSLPRGGAEVSVLKGTLLDLVTPGTVSAAKLASALSGPIAPLLENALAERIGALTLIAPEGTPAGPAGRIVNPDPTDYALSPDSFVNRDGAALGGDGCGHLWPASLPLRQFSLYQVVVHDEPGSEKAGARLEKSAKPGLPSVTARIAFDNRIRWGRILEFKQVWTSLGHSLGEVKYSLALAPGEAVKIAVIDWKREDEGRRAAGNAANDTLAHEQGVDRSIEDIVNGSVSERQSGESFMAGLAGAMDFTVPQYGISAAGRHSVGFGMSNTRGNRDLSAEAQQAVHLRTLQRSNLARSQNSTVIVQATQAESNYLATRIVANMNRGHSLSILYHEILRHLAVRTEFLRSDTAVLIPVELFPFGVELAMQYRAQLEPALLDRKYAAGFDAMERAAAGVRAVPATPAAQPATVPAAGTGTGGPAASTIATRFAIELQSGRRWDLIGEGYKGKPDTAGDFQILARLENGQEAILLDRPLSGIGTETFGIMMNNPTGFPGWRFEAADVTIKTGPFGSQHQDIGRIIATYTTTPDKPVTVDLKAVRGIVVKWRTSFPYDGWNLLKLKVTATCGDGKSYDVVDHAYSVAQSRTHHEVFDPVTPDKFGQYFENSEAPYRMPSFPAPAPATGGAGTRSATSGTTPPPPPPSGSGAAAIGDTELIRLLLNHLNANHIHYSGSVWLGMDASERRLRIAPFAGDLLAGMSDVPFALSGNHLAFRYSGSLPAEARARLPEKEVPGPARETVVTLPTRGVFAEARLGNCNAAEERDITRLWNFDELPVSLLPNIDTLTAGPRGALPAIAPDAMGASPLSIQGAPTLPAPGEAIAKALELLAKPDIFRDSSAREQVAQIMGRLIESAKPPAMTGAGVGSAWGSGKAAAGEGVAADKPDHGSEKDHGGGSGPARRTPARRFDDTTVDRAVLEQARGNGVPADQLADLATTSASRLLASSEADALPADALGGSLPRALDPYPRNFPGKTAQQAEQEKLARIFGYLSDAEFGEGEEINTYFDFNFNGQTGARTYLGYLRHHFARLGFQRPGAWDPLNGAVHHFNFSYGAATEGNFTKFWDSIPVIFGKDRINMLEFLTLDLITHMEGYGDYRSVSEGQREHKDLAYFFDPDGRTGKRSYNTLASNRSCFSLFADADFNAAFAGRIPANPAWDKADEAWKGSKYADTRAPAGTGAPDAAYIAEADFYKFRGRGFIQITNRENYRGFLEYLRGHPNEVPEAHKAILAGFAADTQVALTKSTNADWDSLLLGADQKLAYLSIRRFGELHGHCFEIPFELARLTGHGPHTVAAAGAAVNHPVYGPRLALAARKILLRMYDDIAARG